MPDVNGVVAIGAGDGPDGELLRQYAAAGCQRSFAVVVARHAVLVRQVCRRVTAGTGVDPDDVAQAVFATLAPAGGVADRDAVGRRMAAPDGLARGRPPAADAVTRGRHERAAGTLRLAAADDGGDPAAPAGR